MLAPPDPTVDHTLQKSLSCSSLSSACSLVQRLDAPALALVACPVHHALSSASWYSCIMHDPGSFSEVGDRELKVRRSLK